MVFAPGQDSRGFAGEGSSSPFLPWIQDGPGTRGSSICFSVKGKTPAPATKASSLRDRVPPRWTEKTSNKDAETQQPRLKIGPLGVRLDAVTQEQGSHCPGAAWTGRRLQQQVSH